MNLLITTRKLNEILKVSFEKTEIDYATELIGLKVKQLDVIVDWGLAQAYVWREENAIINKAVKDKDLYALVRLLGQDSQEFKTFFASMLIERYKFLYRCSNDKPIYVFHAFGKDELTDTAIRVAILQAIVYTIGKQMAEQESLYLLLHKSDWLQCPYLTDRLQANQPISVSFFDHEDYDTVYKEIITPLAGQDYDTAWHNFYLKKMADEAKTLLERLDLGWNSDTELALLLKQLHEFDQQLNLKDAEELKQWFTEISTTKRPAI